MCRLGLRLIALLVFGGMISAAPAVGQSDFPEDYYDAYLLQEASPAVIAPQPIPPRASPSRPYPPQSILPQSGPPQAISSQSIPPRPIPVPSGPPRSVRPQLVPQAKPLQQTGYQQTNAGEVIPGVVRLSPEAPAPVAAPVSKQIQTTAGEYPCLDGDCYPGFAPHYPSPYVPPQPVPGAPYGLEPPRPDVVPESVPSQEPWSPTIPQQQPGPTPPNMLPQQPPATPQPVMAPQAGASFGAGLAGGALMASTSAPAMIGDAFGPGAQSIAFVRPVVSQAFAATTRPIVPQQSPFFGLQSGVEYDGFLAADISQGVAGGTFFARRAQGGFVPLTYGVDTNGDGAGDLFTGLAAFAATSSQSPTTQISADPNTVINAGPFEVEATGTRAANLDVFDVIQPLVIQLPSPSAGGGVVGRQKVAENTSPLPQNRVFLGYSRFDSVPLAPGGVNVHRLTPGIEKTFLYDRFSVEARMPFASTLNSDILAGGLTPTGQIELGNFTANIKGIISQSETTTFSLGLQAFFPTADDVRVFAPSGQTLVHVENQAIHLLPFLGMLVEPNDAFFIQGFVQFDEDIKGNAVRIDPDGSGLRKIGRADDPTFFYADLAFGWWLHRSMRGAITGIIPMAEIHHTQALEDFSSVRSGGFVVGTGIGRFNNTNVVLGGTVQFGSGSAVTVGYGFPVGDKTDKQFDGELRVTMNHYFQ